MADRTYFPAEGSLDRRIVTLFGQFTVGATGAVTLADLNGFSLTRLGVGNYRITLDDKYPASPAKYVSGTATSSPLESLGVTVQDAGTRVFRTMTITAESIATNGRIDIIFDSAANTPGELNTGAIVKFMITLKNSSVPRKGV